MAKTTSLLQQKLIEKIASIHEIKENFVSSIEGFIAEADKQFSTLLAVKDNSFFVESYMNVMKVMDQCLNSFVMLTAFADTLQGNFLSSMNEHLAGLKTDLDLNHNPEWMQHQKSLAKNPQKTDACLTSTSNQTQHKLPSTQVKHSMKIGQHCSQSATSQPETKTMNEELSEISTTVSSLNFDHHKDSDENIDVYIGNIASHVKQEDLKELVKDFDPIDVRRRYNKDDRRKVFAFVTFRTLKNAENCMKALHGYKHSGRPLNCRLTESALKGNKPVKDSSSNVSVENDSCYNSLKADARGNYTVCYPRSMENSNTRAHDLQQKFGSFGNFSEVHFTSTMIFVRFKSKRSAVEALEAFSRELNMTIANPVKRRQFSSHESGGQTPNSGFFLSHQSEEISQESNQGFFTDQTSPSAVSSYQSCYTEQNNPGLYQQYTQEDKFSEYSEGQTCHDSFDGQEEDFSCILSEKKDYQPKIVPSCTSEELDEGIQSSYLKQLRKIWKE